MRSYFLYMAGWNGRITRSIIAIVLMLASLIPGIYPANLILFIAGMAVLSAAIWNLLMLAPLFGYPISGSKIKQSLDEDSLEHKMERGKKHMRDPGKTNSGQVTADFKPDSVEHTGYNTIQDSIPTQSYRHENDNEGNKQQYENDNR